MTIRRRFRTLAGMCLVLATGLSLAACDGVSKNDLSGVWIGTATFSADTILADQNLRFVADYDATFTFRITDDEGLITGTVEGTFDGQRTTTEAGFPSQAFTFDPSVKLTNDVFGTFIDPVLEMDVPDGPYELDLWTFDVTGNSADLDRFLTHNHTILMSDSTEFIFPLDSDELFEMSYQGSN